MGKRKDSRQIQRLLQDADRDLVKGLTVTDVCRKHGISGNTYYRWRQRHDPATADDARRVRELEWKWAGFGCRLARTLSELFDVGFVERLSCIGRREGRPYDAVVDGPGDR